MMRASDWDNYEMVEWIDSKICVDSKQKHEPLSVWDEDSCRKKIMDLVRLEAACGCSVYSEHSCAAGLEFLTRRFESFWANVWSWTDEQGDTFTQFWAMRCAFALVSAWNKFDIERQLEKKRSTHNAINRIDEPQKDTCSDTAQNVGTLGQCSAA